MLVNGKIPANTVCPFRAHCGIAANNECHHQGLDHNNEFSCGTARAFELINLKGTTMAETETTKEIRPPIKGGWRGHLNGFVEKSGNTHVQASEITLKVDNNLAWALCNVLLDQYLENHPNLENGQRESLSEFGAALGRFIDHNSANNGGRKIIK